MYTIYGEKYHNDFTRQNFTMRFDSLGDIFNYMKKISNNFSSTSSTWFPVRKGRTDYTWCSRLSCRNEDDSLYRDFWVYQIDSPNGTVYSDGRYTKGEKFCSKKVEAWLAECQNIARNTKPKFVED